MRPNHFIAIRINNPHIHSGVKIVQDSIVENDEELKPALNPLATLHLTLLVVHLEDEEKIQKAKEILHQCKSILEKEPILQNGTLTLNFKGLDNFEDKVLFVKPCGKEGNERLNKLANIVRETFAENGIPSTDSREFKAHLTIMDLKRSRKLRKGIKIPVATYSLWADSEFGEERVTGLHLCSMKEKDEDGFYKCEASVKFDADNKASA